MALSFRTLGVARRRLLDGCAEVREVAAMAAKKMSKRPAPASSAPAEEDAIREAIALMAVTLGNHDAAVRQLAEVVVNLHQNIRALRDVVEPLADRSTDERVVQARARLRRVKLDE